MPIYDQLHFRPQVTDVKNEEDLTKVLLELKSELHLEGYKGEIKDAVDSARSNGGVVLIPKTGTKNLPREVDVSLVVEQIKQYELHLRNLCGNCKKFVSEYARIEGREQYCEVDKTRGWNAGPCQGNFENKYLPMDSRPLEVILSEI